MFETDATQSAEEGDSSRELFDSYMALDAMLHSLSSMLAAETKVAPSDLVAYNHIRLYGPLSAKEVAHRVQMSSGATTALIDRLVKRGYVKRVPHASDRRSVMVQALTRETLSVPKLDVFLDRLRARISRLEPAERNVIITFFDELTEDVIEALNEDSTSP